MGVGVEAVISDSGLAFVEDMGGDSGDELQAVHRFLRPIIKEVVERYLDCGNPRCGFARIRCPDCGEERLLMFSCRTRGFCPSCHAKRLEEWGEWAQETLLLDVPHRQVVFTIPTAIS
jgi:ribosomal protein S27E